LFQVSVFWRGFRTNLLLYHSLLAAHARESERAQSYHPPRLLRRSTPPRTLSAAAVGPSVGPTQTGSVDFDPPPDNPSSPSPVQAAVYTVAVENGGTARTFGNGCSVNLPKRKAR
jgi:hypothetical protein